jgi:hypothetical protein
MGAHHPKVTTVRDIGQALDIDLGVLFRYGQIQIVQERKRFVLVAPYDAAGRSILDFQAFQARGFVVRHPECVVNLLSDRKAMRNDANAGSKLNSAKLLRWLMSVLLPLWRAAPVIQNRILRVLFVQSMHSS